MKIRYKAKSTTRYSARSIPPIRTLTAIAIPIIANIMSMILNLGKCWKMEIKA